MGRIRMTQTIDGCMDGIHPKKFTKDQEYEIDNNEINQKLADIFINCSAAVSVRARKPIEVPEKAVIKEAPETKFEMSASEMRKAAEKSDAKETTPDPEDSGDSKPEAKNTRVFQLSDELEASWKDIIKIANKLGIDVKKAQSGLMDTEAEAIRVAFKK